MTARIVSEITAAQGIGLPIGTDVAIKCSPSQAIHVRLPPRILTLSELQRLKRQFVSMHKKAITQGATEHGDVDWSEDGIAVKFGDYLEERLS
jgi:protein KTI12